MPNRQHEWVTDYNQAICCTCARHANPSRQSDMAVRHLARLSTMASKMRLILSLETCQVKTAKRGVFYVELAQKGLRITALPKATQPQPLHHRPHPRLRERL